MQKIPKVIHYVWVGPKPFSKLAETCLASWKKYLPDYELRFWNEDNAPMDHPYVQQMYQAGKWAFVSDYIRFWALEREGGIYLDTDTEVLKSFDDLLAHSAFYGQTKDGVIAAGVIGAEPHHPSIQAMLARYDALVGDTQQYTSPQVVTEVLCQKRYEDVTVYDYRYFNPCDDGERCGVDKLTLAYTNNHWAESWVQFAKLRKLLRRLGLMKTLKRLYGNKAK